MERLLDVPLADLLYMLRARLRDRATEQYHTELLVWSSLAPHQKKASKPPELPEILRT